MNPYLEMFWGDVHTSLVTYARDQLQERLPDALRARAQERVFVEAAQEMVRSFEPDIHVYQRPGEAGEGVAVAQAPLAQPLAVLEVPLTEVTENYLEIIDARSGGRVVTLIEFVSRSNKRSGRGRDEYIRKRDEARAAGVNVVEIDLLRAGQAVTLVPPAAVPPPHRTPYHACVWRASKPGTCLYYALPLRLPLPKLSIPLRPDDADVPLDLQELIDQSYIGGRYDDIDYRRPPDPPLAAEDAAWAEAVLKGNYPEARG
jgi:hypothetical protein